MKEKKEKKKGKTRKERKKKGQENKKDKGKKKRVSHGCREENFGLSTKHFTPGYQKFKKARGLVLSVDNPDNTQRSFRPT